jgi:hypothetical protein
MATFGQSFSAPSGPKAMKRHLPDVHYKTNLLTGHFVNLQRRREGIAYPTRHFLLHLMAQYLEGFIASLMHVTFDRVHGPILFGTEEQTDKWHC